MAETEIKELIELREQMLRLRSDDGLVTGVTFNTLAGDITIQRKEMALMLIDSVVSDIQKQINYLSK